MSREDLGRSSWLFLHTIAAHYPDNPSHVQRQDAERLIDILTRIYPCAECAEHFANIVAHKPPDVSSGTAFREWLCAVHNEVNYSLDKPQFNCAFVHARCSGLDCTDDLNACVHSHGLEKNIVSNGSGKRLGI